MSLLAFLGCATPGKMLPVLLFDALWKLLWFSVVALPCVLEGGLQRGFFTVVPRTHLSLPYWLQLKG
jgi:hypothetical protein